MDIDEVDRNEIIADILAKLWEISRDKDDLALFTVCKLLKATLSKEERIKLGDNMAVVASFLEISK
jgi:hypothetical protein